MLVVEGVVVVVRAGSLEIEFVVVHVLRGSLRCWR